jgi:hypothetical protein
MSSIIIIALASADQRNRAMRAAAPGQHNNRRIRTHFSAAFATPFRRI